MNDFDKKYDLVKTLFLEKINDASLVSFEYTPGINFMEMPIYDCVTALLDVHKQVFGSKKLDFGDLNWISNPPTTNIKKRALSASN